MEKNQILVACDPKAVEQIGKSFAEGVVTTLAKWFCIGLLVVFLFAAVADYFRWGFDGTDDKAAGERSGMAIHTDHATGCQYLATSKGFLTPRLNETGKPICN